ncbi:hypothetical protein CANARDRAFT_9087 [[Candida] arabinofermentans NRRL YB-2248]|uniref:ABC transporter domain-containing protein n=1 Tax=[Candida] arabinofermentans NRRL YB-2248 TaxID=983967 RepID=A0A1E4SX58_9ASCO|nr:hypothetical protein CANARDRAFT_9087 [[Candida] arabinofermentans NRRL YB-2248]
MTHSEQASKISDQDDVVSYNETHRNEISDIYQTITRSVSNNQDDNVLTRLSTLSKTLSKMTAKEMSDLKMNPDDFDLGKILKFLAKKNEEQGIPARSTDVIFENFTVIGNNMAASIVPTVADIIFAPYFLIKNKLSKKTQAATDLSKLPKTREIIRNVTGFAEAGGMTLVLGRPGAGCSTLLKAVAGQTQTYRSTEGSVDFSGIPLETMMKRYKTQIIYNPELDVHFPYLTVEQTIKFAIGCKTPSVRIDNISRNEYIQVINDLYLTLYGLKHVEKTLVGDDFVRGISGGQRKRVSIAEAMVTRASVFCFDNATRGLDASTALEFVESLRTSTNVANSATLVTIYQAAENIYRLFDHVTVLYLGRQIYFGPIDEAVDYFTRMGFKKFPRETSPEFLTVVTDPLARVPLPGFENKVPSTPDDFEAYWLQSPEYQQLLETIKQKRAQYQPSVALETFRDAHRQEKQNFSRKTSIYTTNFFVQLKLCCLRGVNNIVNNKSYTVTLILAALIQSLIVGSLYYNITEGSIGSFSRGGVIFFGLLYFCIMSLAEVSSIFATKPILSKQRGYSLYHPSAEFLGSTLTQLPVRMFAILLFALILYFLSDLKREAGAFFTFYLFINMTVICINAYITLAASLCSSVNSANAVAGITAMTSVIYSSFMIQRPSMHWWFKWYSYMNPILYGFEAMITMEFRGRRMPCSPTQLLPRGVGYENISSANQVCAFVGGSISKEMYGNNDVNGEVYLSLAFLYTFDHCWRNLGILFGIGLGVLAINSLVVEFYNPIVPSADKMLFVKGANIPSEVISHIAAAAMIDQKDLESIGGSVNDFNEVKESHRATADATIKKLGSDDIFMWQHVNYTVPYQGEARQLLQDVQGVVLPGTLTALMGESGAGKTTLLNVLSRRTEVGVVTGDMLINGKAIDNTFESKTGYVQQQDLHIAELTVRESLNFAARMRRPPSVPDEEKLAYVQTILEILNMEDYADSVAGCPGFGLNVEQRKKLSIATELVAKPSLLLFLDEPTSGLDSQSSWAIIQVLRSLAEAGQAILCTIHQPSATLFEQFDKLLLLKTGGQTVYFGDIGDNSRILLDYFESRGARTCQNGENPAEYILEAIGAGATAVAQENWHDKWIKSKEYTAVTEQITKLIQDTAHLPSGSSDHGTSSYAMPYMYQLRQVIIRTFTQFNRDLDYVMSKLMLMLLAGLLTGFSFWNVKHTVIGMQNLLFAAFMALIVSAPIINQVQAKAIQSRELYEVRESKSNTFHWSCLLIAQFLVEIPYSIVCGTVYFVVWYFPVQVDNEPSRAGLWWFTQSFFFQLYYVSLALAVVYASPDLPSANVLVGLLFNFIVSFCGVVQPPSSMPHFWKFMWRASPFTYIIQNLVGILLHDRPVVCSDTELNYLEPPDGQTCGNYLATFFESHAGYVKNPDDTSNCGVCQYKVGDEYLKTVGISYSYRWRNIGFFCIYIIANVVFMISLYYTLRVRKFSLTGLISRKKK